MSTQYWYYVQGTEKVGPIPEQELKNLFAANQLDNDTLVWREGEANWTAASQFPELTSQQVADALKAQFARVSSGLKQEPVPVIDNEDWFYVADKKSFGPISHMDLIQKFLLGELDSRVLVWNKNMNGWTSAQEVPEIVSLLPVAAQLAIFRPAAAAPLPSGVNQSTSAFDAANLAQDRLSQQAQPQVFGKSPDNYQRICPAGDASTIDARHGDLGLLRQISSSQEQGMLSQANGGQVSAADGPTSSSLGNYAAPPANPRPGMPPPPSPKLGPTRFASGQQPSAPPPNSPSRRLNSRLLGSNSDVDYSGNSANYQNTNQEIMVRPGARVFYVIGAMTILFGIYLTFFGASAGKVFEGVFEILFGASFCAIGYFGRTVAWVYVVGFLLFAADTVATIMEGQIHGIVVKALLMVWMVRGFMPVAMIQSGNARR